MKNKKKVIVSIKYENWIFWIMSLLQQMNDNMYMEKKKKNFCFLI